MTQEVCFITCTNDKRQYRQCSDYIRKLKVPEGYRVRLLPIYNATGMAAGYNRAMYESRAKYKIYLHQDVFIINQNIIYDCIELFLQNPKLGMLGVVGCKKLSKSGVWWESDSLYGMVGDGKKDIKFLAPTQSYESVMAIDGLLMITQYDIMWNERIFTGWHFYDTSQSLEFIRANYEVGIPFQVDSWCVHKSGQSSRRQYNRYKRRLKEYYKSFLEM